jgi:ribonucleoside-diphosphate reductase alpha chain
VRSLPDGVAQVLAEYLEETNPSSAQGSSDEDLDNLGSNGHKMMSETALSGATYGSLLEQMPLKFGDLCPECGQATVVNEEGCRKCYTCGYSEC